jgi:hypothetical protein
VIVLDVPALVRSSGRSWWEARYSSSRVVSEFDVATGNGAVPQLIESVRWDELEGDGLVGLRLLCPDGSVAELASREDHRLFQFKVGGIAAAAGSRLQWCTAQVIGAVIDVSGRCVCRAWETSEGRLVEFEDNVFAMRYQTIGALALENIGVRI